MNYCSECGQPVIKHPVPGDRLPRYQCTACQRIHYQNPKILVSCYATWQQRVLWIRRATEPHAGLWAAPSGYAEEGESLMQAAARELYEETRARVDMDRMALHLVGNLLQMNQVYVVFRAPLLSPDFCTTDEASEVRLFDRHEFPQAEFAYPEVADNVTMFYDDLCNNDFDVYLGALENGRNQIRKVARHY